MICECGHDRDDHDSVLEECHAPVDYTGDRVGDWLCPCEQFVEGKH